MVEERTLLRDRLRSPFAARAVVLIQIVAVFGYLIFWLSGPTRSELALNIEWASFFVMPFVSLALFAAGLWLLRQPLARKSHVAVKGGLILPGLCGAVAVSVACMFVAGEIIFRLTGF
jgi:hypothetical protein